MRNIHFMYYCCNLLNIKDIYCFCYSNILLFAGFLSGESLNISMKYG